MLIDIMPSAIMLSDIVLSDIMVSDIILSDIIQNAFMLCAMFIVICRVSSQPVPIPSVVKLSVLAPLT